MKNLSLNKKVIFLLCIFIFANIVTVYVSLSKISEINDSLNNLVNTVAKRLTIAKSMDALTNEIKNQEKVFILEENVSEMNKISSRLDELELQLRTLLKEYDKIALPVGKAEIVKMEEKINKWKDISVEMRKLSLTGQNKEAIALARGPSQQTWNDFDSSLNVMVERNEKTMEDESTRTDLLVDTTRNLVISVTLIALAIGGILAFFMIKAISSAIDQVIANLNDSSAQVASASSQIASSSEELSQATTEQAASLEETASSVEEMSSMISRNTDNARLASENSMHCQDNALKGKETVNEMIQSIDEINESNNKIMEQINYSNGQLADIVKVISEIENKTKVINDIVFQTKLLSFNASVEAARAGEHGKGFAVVAEEVGNLAAMSGNAAKEISSMLEESILKVETIVTETKTSVDRLIADGKKKVDNGTRIARNCGEVLDDIVMSVTKVSNMANEISTASKEQSEGITEITKAMHQLDQVTQQNASASHEAASAAEQLSVQAEALKSAVGVLVSTIKGGEQQQLVITADHRQSQSLSNRVERKHARTDNIIKFDKKRVSDSAKLTTLKKTGTDTDKTPAYNDNRFTDV